MKEKQIEVEPRIKKRPLALGRRAFFFVGAPFILMIFNQVETRQDGAW